MNAVLKAQSAATAPHSRSLRPPADLQAHVPPPTGRFITDADLDALLGKAFEDGFHRGRQQGEQQASEAARRDADQRAQQALDRAVAEHRAQLQRAQMEKWRAMATALSAQMQGIQKRLEAEVTEWTFAAVTRLLGHASEEQLRSAVHQVLVQARLRKPVHVLVHRDDLALLQREPAEWPEDVCFAADPAVALGGCLVRSSHETLDARLEVQLQFLREALDAARRDRQMGED